jgi:hypothetical protein
LKPEGVMHVRLPNGQKYDGVWESGAKTNDDIKWAKEQLSTAIQFSNKPVEHSQLVIEAIGNES